MPRFYFDVHDGISLIDDEGVECADRDAARHEALQAAGAMLREKPSTWSGETWTMEVRDDRRRIVATLTFSASWSSADEDEQAVG